jgi:hypothetical protein
MKRIGISIFASLLLVSGVFAQRSIVVTNNTGIDRKAEMVEAIACCKKSCISTKYVVLKNKKGEEVPYQLVYNDKKEVQSIIFQADVKANSSAKYTLTEGKPTHVTAKVFGRFVPERKDDFAWENDFGAYRMYGPALAKENASNGVDFWAKCTDELVVDQRYKDDIYNKISYHIDHGKGLDFYKVAHTLGCGGIAPYSADSLWVGNQFSSYKVIENGPLRTVFTLTYDSVKIGTDFYKEIITITANAGSLLNKAVVTFTGKSKKMDLAGGIFLHDGKGNLELKKENGTVAYAEEATSDFKVPAGRNYIGVYVPGKENGGMKKGEHAFISSNYKVGSKFTYYFGGGWSKWKFPTDADWFNAVADFAAKIKKPLIVKMK